MKKIFCVLILGAFLAGCASIPKQTVDQKVTKYEQQCLPLMNTIIEEKLSRAENTSTREKWEEVILGDYRTAKNTSNSESVRNEAIGSAILNCMVQERLR